MGGLKMSNRKNYLYGLEHIRSLACVFILLFHSTLFISLNMKGVTDLTLVKDNLFRTKNIFLTLILEGHTFVSLFLIISGFVLLVGVFAFPDRFDLLRFITSITIFGNIYPIVLSPCIIKLGK